MTDRNASSRADAPHDCPDRDHPEPSAVKSGLAQAVGLSAQEIAAISKAREARWRPGLADQPFHSEIFASAHDASGAGVALALARDALGVERMGAGAAEDPLAEAEDRRCVLWVQDTDAIKRSGRPYLHGLPSELRDRLIHVEAKTSQDALFALEEGLKCRDLACVIGEIFGNPRELDFTASRRLSLAAEKHGVALWLVRLDAQADLSSARMRWRVEPARSPPPRWNAEAPGPPTWQAELFRASRHAPGQWMLSDDKTLSVQRLPTRQISDEQATPQDTEHTREKGPNILGPALARQRRFWHPGGAPAASSSRPGSSPNLGSSFRPAQSAFTPDTGHLVRATVGRSLAARARP
ncbi:MAG: recA-like protein [Pseudomonadota bacterium]